MSLDVDILNDFYKESNTSIVESIDLLESKEGETNAKLYDATAALLLDAVEALNVLIKKIELPMDQLKQVITPNFIERLRWVSEQFSKQSSLQAQSKIDVLVKKLGF